MRVEEDIKLDFKDVLIRPKRSTLHSRKEVDLSRTYTFKHSYLEWTGVPIMDFFTNDTGINTARILRESTDNGTLLIQNNGTGGINTVHGTTTVVTTNSSGMSVFAIS